MDRYLDQYIGKYRVKAHYDLGTNDFPRDGSGNIANDFADFYIACANDGEIRHVCPEPYGRNHELAFFLPHPNKGKNIAVRIMEDYLKKDIGLGCSKEKTEKLAQTVDLFTSFEITDGELWFTFKPENLDYIAKFVKASTYGANTPPLSPKNLPKNPSIISKEDEQKYKDIISKSSLEKMQLAQVIRKVNAEFQETKLPKKWKEESKKLKMKFKDYVYHKGLWKKYLIEIEKAVN